MGVLECENKNRDYKIAAIIDASYQEDEIDDSLGMSAMACVVYETR